MKKYIVILLLSLSGNLAFVIYYTYKKVSFLQSKKAVVYDNNTQFAEQTAIFPAYNSPCDIAFIGDSHIFKCHWDEILGRPTCNRGIGSDIVAGVHSRIADVIKLKPRVCFICAGANDAARGLDQATTLYYYTDIVKQLKEAGIKPVIMLVPSMSDTAANGQLINSRISSLNVALRSLGESISISVEPADLQPDGVHLTASGYLKWKKEIESVIK